MTRPAIALLLALLVCAMPSGAGASSIFMTPAVSSAVPGQSVTFELWMDFEETIIGGAFEVLFDPATLTFQSWTSAGLGMPDFFDEPYIGDGRFGLITFGDFHVGITGRNLIGTIALRVREDAAIGLTSILPAPISDCACGPAFVDFDTYAVIYPDYVGANVEILSSAVPAPASLWLAVSAASVLAGVARRRHFD